MNINPNAVFNTVSDFLTVTGPAITAIVVFWLLFYSMLKQIKAFVKLFRELVGYVGTIASVYVDIRKELKKDIEADYE